MRRERHYERTVKLLKIRKSPIVLNLLVSFWFYPFLLFLFPRFNNFSKQICLLFKAQFFIHHLLPDSNHRLNKYVNVQENKIIILYCMSAMKSLIYCSEQTDWSSWGNVSEMCDSVTSSDMPLSSLSALNAFSYTVFRTGRASSCCCR